MLEHFFENLVTVRSLRSNMLGPHLDSYVGALDALGYTRSTIRWMVWRVADFGAWLKAHESSVTALDDCITKRFVDERNVQGRHCRGQLGVLCRFVAHLREQGVLAFVEEKREASPIEAIEHRYERYLRVERGLSTASVVNYLPFVDRLLRERFGSGEPQLGELCPSDIYGFVVRYAHTMSPGRAKLMVTAFRSFFRYLLQCDEIDVDLAQSVPSVADWRLSSVPKFLESEQVEQILGACDQTTAVGRRDYAILLLLARLGLRAGEVVALEFDDIDWRMGNLRIKGKGLTVDKLPLLADVGKALATYLQQDRPSCASRRVFLRMRAPRRGFSSAAAVTNVVERAIDRTGLQPPTKGAHLLRHSLATRLLRNGASMAEIAELLRHSSPRTTEIYAKVDICGLRSLARPWPITGGVQ